MKPRIVISINTAWNIFNFRMGLVRALIDQGYEVIAVAPSDEYAPRLESLGCRFVALPMDGNGTHPGRDFILLVRYLLLLRSLRPAAFLGYTIKPNVYGSLAANMLGIPVINNIAGLGATFIRDNYLTKLVRILYKCALKKSHRVFFQNADDQRLFVSSGLVRRNATGLLPGSGINAANYPVTTPLDLTQRRFRFLFIGRMLRDKGVEELAEATKLLHGRGIKVEVHLLGSIDQGNANAVPTERVRAWEELGLVTYLGRTDDVRPHIGHADCVLLPSYREGVPRSLLEAAAMARPVIATDVAGCRDVVDDQINGYLCRVNDPVDLAEKMVQMISLTPEQRNTMGAAGRRKIEVEFDEQIVIQKYLGTLGSIPVNRSQSDAVADLLSEKLNS